MPFVACFVDGLEDFGDFDDILTFFEEFFEVCTSLGIVGLGIEDIFERFDCIEIVAQFFVLDLRQFEFKREDFALFLGIGDLGTNEIDVFGPHILAFVDSRQELDSFFLTFIDFENASICRDGIVVEFALRFLRIGSAIEDGDSRFVVFCSVELCIEYFEQIGPRFALRIDFVESFECMGIVRRNFERRLIEFFSAFFVT